MEKQRPVKPRIIIHGGAGNILPENLSQESYHAFREALLDILDQAHQKLSHPGATALDVATFAVSLLENNGLFNSGHGAVFTTAGEHELEASVMVSSGYRKRGVGVMGVKGVKNPILLAREMLIRGENEDGGGALHHNQLHGETCVRLAEQWGLKMAKPSYFWSRIRWNQHREGLGLPHDDRTYREAKKKADENWKGEDEEDPPDASVDVAEGETVGAVVLDRNGTICCATSTGGLTNKLPGRIGDTPTLGAGFWAGEWSCFEDVVQDSDSSRSAPWAFSTILGDCLPALIGYEPVTSTPREEVLTRIQRRRAVGISGTGNGDSFLRTSASSLTAHMAQFSPVLGKPKQQGLLPLQICIGRVAGPDGFLQQSAGTKWRKTGEGEGGMIGIDYIEGKSPDGCVVADFNCGGMFRAWVDDGGRKRMAVFREEGYPGDGVTTPRLA